MSAINVRRRGFALIACLLDQLLDPARRERTTMFVLICYAMLWTLYAVVAKGSRDIHADMSEQFALSRELAWGYAKHPPLAPALVRAWFTVFPTADWAYYLLATTTVGFALWIAWRLLADFVDGDKRAIGLALLTMVPLFNFHALKFNANTVLLPLWGATTLAFLRSFETRSVSYASLAGLAAAAAMYGKHWSIVLLLGLGLAALLDSRRAAYFRSPAPWVTIAVGTLALAPHLAWLVANDFAPFSYAVEVHGTTSVAAELQSVFRYAFGAIAYVIVPVVVVVLAARPSRRAVVDMIWPAGPQRRLAALAFWATLLLPVVIAVFGGIELTSLWTMSAWTLLPVILLSSPLVAIGRHNAQHILALTIMFSLLMIAVAPAIGLAVHRADLLPGMTQTSVVAKAVERLWQQTTDRPMKVFAGIDEFTDGVAFYMRVHPRALHVLDDPVTDRVDQLPPAIKQRIDREGIVLLCPVRTHLPPDAALCLKRADWIAAQFLAGQRSELELSRRYLGFDGQPARYRIISIAPRW
jgi:4-amino-4-deoxy-L-arabinose transferase-like glycosyltransferase